MLSNTIPGELHLDPAVFVAMDFTVDGPSHYRVLITRQGRPRLLRQGGREILHHRSTLMSAAQTNQ